MAQPATPTARVSEAGSQIEATAREAVAWLRTDSLDALIAVAVGAGIFFALLAVRDMGCRLLGRGEHKAVWRAVVGRVAKRTHAFFLAALSADLVVNVVAPPGKLLNALDMIFTVAAVLQGAIWLRELILVVVARRAAEQSDDQSTLANAMGVIRVLVNVAVFAVALILILDNLGVNVTALVAGLGIGGIAIGLAAQGIFSDLFAALAILFDRPFRRGDTIQYGTTIGTVEAIGLKTTRLRALSGEQVVMANTKLLEQEVRNLRLIEERRVVSLLPLSPSSHPEAVAGVPALLKALVEGQEDVRFGHAVVLGVSAQSIDVELVYHVERAEAEFMAQTRHAILVGALKAFEAAGIRTADLTPPRG